MPMRGGKGVALLISVLALVLAFAETLGKSAQTAALSYNIEASNLWAFYQSKTIRRTTLRTAAEQLELLATGDKAKEQISSWKKTAERYQNEPDTGEGRDQLEARAKAAEAKARPVASRLPPLRNIFRGGADRHCARLGVDHHRHARAGLDGGRAGSGGDCLLRDRLLVPGRSPPVLARRLSRRSGTPRSARSIPAASTSRWVTSLRRGPLSTLTPFLFR